MLGKRRFTNTAPPPNKRKKSTSAIEEINFDPNAREDYLTGFHKRKLQRIKHAQEEAGKKDREERIIARKILREGRRADLEKHVETVNSVLRRADSGAAVSESEDGGATDEEWGGIAEIPEFDGEAEYIEEDRHTTVTIEAVDVTREGFRNVFEGEEEGSTGSGVQEATVTSGKDSNGKVQAKTKRVWTKERPEGPKKKKKKFRYESRAERKVTRYKERLGNKAKAKARKE